MSGSALMLMSKSVYFNPFNQLGLNSTLDWAEGPAGMRSTCLEVTAGALVQG